MWLCFLHTVQYHGKLSLDIKLIKIPVDTINLSDAYKKINKNWIVWFKNINKRLSYKGNLDV